MNSKAAYSPNVFMYDDKLLPSMLKLPNEISGARFGPNGKAVLVNLTFISMHLMSLQFLTLEILAALGFLKGRPKEAGDI